jgi:replicative DNA helicase
MDDIHFDDFLSADPTLEDEQAYFEVFDDDETSIPDSGELADIFSSDEVDFSYDGEVSCDQLDQELTLTKGKLMREKETTKAQRLKIHQLENQLRFQIQNEKKSRREVSSVILDRVPPCAIDIEQVVLGLYFHDPALMEGFSQPYLNLMWYDNAHKVVHGAMMDLGPKTEVNLLTEKLRHEGLFERVGGAGYIGRILKAGENKNPKVLAHYLRVLEEKYLAREIIDRATRILRDAYEESTTDAGGKLVPIHSMSEYIRDASSALLELLPYRFRRATDLAAIADETIEEFNDLVKRKGKPKISTGHKGLDRIMHGVLPHRLTLMGARTKMGKTSLALNIMYNVASQGYPAAIFSLECSRYEVMQKLIAMHAGVDSERFVYWEDDSIPDEEIANIHSATAHIKQLPFHIDDSKPNLNYIVSRTHQLKALHPDLALVVVDGLQGFKGHEPYQGNKSDIYYEILKDLKSLAVDAGVGVILNCQLKVDVEKRKDKKPKGVEDFSDCKGIPEVADNAIMLYRPEFYFPGNPQYRGWTSVIPMVMRIGDKKGKTVRLYSDMKTSRYSEENVL